MENFVEYTKNITKSVPERITWLIFWPVFGACFYYLELVGVEKYHYIHCSFDYKIPFCEYFVIPYYFWFIFLFGMIFYGFFYDMPAFRNYMKFTVITYSMTLIAYIIYPNAQDLRPQTFLRENIFVDIVKMLYSHDTNTNVCPSIHVLGSLSVYFAARKSKVFGTRTWRISLFLIVILITSSTLFLKQHSIIDILAALVVAAIAYPMVYGRKTVSEAEAKKTTAFV